MARRKLVIPVSLVLFLAGTLVGVYFVRGYILRVHMVSALEADNADDILELLNSWPCPVDACARGGYTALAWAALNNRRDIVDLALKRGASPEGASGRAESPLQLALRFGRTGIAQLLVDHGADISRTDTTGWTLLHSAVWDRRPDSVEFLLARGLDVNLQTVTDQSQAPLQFVTDTGTVLTPPWEQGGTPLHVASHANACDCARVLLSHGADVTLKDNNGDTPLMLAEKRGYKEMAALLREHGATE